MMAKHTQRSRPWIRKFSDVFPVSVCSDRVRCRIQQVWFLHLIYFTPLASSICLRESDLHTPYQMPSDPRKEKLFDGEIHHHMGKCVLFYMRSKHLVSLILPLLQDVFVQKKERHWGHWGSQTSEESLSVPDFDSCQDQLQTTPPIPPGKLKTSFLFLSTPTCWSFLSGPNVVPIAISTQLSPLSCCVLSNGSFSFWNL